jgi:hypothetical protein
LFGFYQSGQSDAVAEAVMEGLMIAGATEQLIALYRKEADPARKRALLHRIAISDADAALELIDNSL